MAAHLNCSSGNNFCTVTGGTTILTVSIPGGLDINLLGIHIAACPICIAVFTDSTSGLTAGQQNVAGELVNVVKSLIPNIPTA